MKISATLKNQLNVHSITVQTNDSSQEVHIAPKSTGFGSSVNGGELLMVALATCFCNDIYREAKKKNITVSGVEVVVTGEFGAEGEAGGNFQYKAKVHSDAPLAVIEELIVHTDKVAEIQNTLRRGVGIMLNV
jgi:organic hydroperoxide reductase OsmC/OhrA